LKVHVKLEQIEQIFGVVWLFASYPLQLHALVFVPANRSAASLDVSEEGALAFQLSSNFAPKSSLLSARCFFEMISYSSALSSGKGLFAESRRRRKRSEGRQSEEVGGLIHSVRPYSAVKKILGG